MHEKTVVAIGRWSMLAVAALFVAGIFPFSSGGARGLTGDTGPITVTVAPAAALADGQAVNVHAKSNDPAVGIFSLTAHLCQTDKVTGDLSFSFARPVCTNTPLGQSDVEQLVTVAGAAQADLQFKVGTGTVDWLTPTGYPGSLTCAPGNPCDLVIRAEITGSTVYFRAPLCFGADCPADADPNAPAVAPATTPPPAAAAPVATDASANESAGSGKAVPSGSSAAGGTPAAAAPAKGSGTSHSSASGEDTADLAGAQSASVVSLPAGGPSRQLRVFVAALAGAIGGARILSVISKTRKRNASGLGVS
jgi:hypothetical protein